MKPYASGLDPVVAEPHFFFLPRLPTPCADAATDLTGTHDVCITYVSRSYRESVARGKANCERRANNKYMLGARMTEQKKMVRA